MQAAGQTMLTSEEFENQGRPVVHVNINILTHITSGPPVSKQTNLTVHRRSIYVVRVSCFPAVSV